MNVESRTAPLLSRFVVWSVSKRPRQTTRYIIASLIILFIAVFRYAAVTSLVPWMLFMPAVMLISLTFGPLVGVYATFLSGVLAAVSMAPGQTLASLTAEQWVGSGLFLIVTSGIAVTAGELRRALWNARRLADETERAKLALGKSEKRYRSLFENIDAGFCISEVKFDQDGRPVDHRVEEANPAFERHTGLADAVGRYASEVAPGIEQHWHDAYGTVARTGKAFRFEGEAKPLGRWYDAHLFPVPDGKVGMLIADTTKRREAEEALARSEEKWRSLFKTLREGFILGKVIRDADGRIVDWCYEEVNDAWYSLVGMASGAVVGKTIREVFPGIEDDWVMDFARVVDTGEPIRFTRQVGSLDRWYEGVAQPSGHDRFTVIFVEVTDRIQRERRQAALVDLNDRLADEVTVSGIALSAGEILGRALGVELAGYGDVDPDAGTVTVDRDWTTGGARPVGGTFNFRDFGSHVDDLKRGETVVVRDCRTDDRTRRHAAALEAAGARAFVNVPIFERGTVAALLYVCTSVPRGWSGEDLRFIHDVAHRLRLAVGRRRAEQQQHILNEELSHRLKNTLSVVQAIAMQTLGRSEDRTAVLEFESRLSALSKAHDLLLRQNWSAADLHDVAASVLGSFGSDRFHLSGPQSPAGPRATLSLSLLLHELATNAVKYGALSVPEGSVDLNWSIRGDGENRLLHMAWTERGGPAAVEPTRKGFGSRLIRMGLIGAGGVELHYRREGLAVEMTAPLHQLQQA
ncbi:HWE histidine kinase domain-containing protein [Azospirillum picis]|uniref:histidine kinase n=1 Tax=Azospirillum picis TaxID=488438 RepID=A0ABU0MRK1_9PROT|nr:HWE histidine kinase domain-containing protein [Azospirillum picis]MBP2302239.1 two-component sensor histidine kinase [Azospirillum picis]MDQ0535818.1 two-component sensor histidine kinase [Azospirillum picis]